MSLLDIFKMKVLGGSLILKDDTFLFVSKITETVFDDETKDVTISYEDGNGKKKEVKLSQIKEARPVSEQSVFSIMNNIAKMKNENYKGYFITNDGNRIDVNLIVSFENLICTFLRADSDDYYETKIELRHIKEVHINTNEKYIKTSHKFGGIECYTLNNGKKQGLYKWYHDDGFTLRELSVYKDGKLEGELKQWDEEDGNLKEHSLYKDDKIVKNLLPSNDPKLNLSRQYAYTHPETIDKNTDLDYQTQGLDYQTQGLDYQTQSLTASDPFLAPVEDKKGLDYETIDCISLKKQDWVKKALIAPLCKKRKVIECNRSSEEVPLMDDDIEQVLNRTREQNYKLIEDLIDKGIEKFEITSQTVPNDVYEILFTSKGKKKWFAVIQNENEDVFILDMNTLFIITAVQPAPTVQPVTKELPPCDKTEKVETDNLPLCKTLIDKKTFYTGFSSEIKTIVGLSKALIADGEVMYNFYMKKTLKETMNEKLLKDNLKDDFTILTDELRKGKHEILIYRDNNLVKLIFNFEENTNIYCETYSSVDANVEFHSKPLPSHLKYITIDDIPLTPKKEKVIGVPQAPRKKNYTTRAGEETPSIPFLIQEVLQTGEDVEEGVDIPTDRIVTFIYKGDEKRVLVKEANDKYTEGICQTDNKYKKYLTRYIEKVIKIEDPSLDENTSSEDEEPQVNLTYKNMVLNTIKTCYVNGTRGLSRQALQTYIMRNYNVKLDNFHNNLRMTLRRLVQTGCIVQTKQKFKLGDEGRKYLKEQQKPKKAEKKTEKGDNIVIQKGPIQDAIDNEKILDIMYDGGSIPDIKRPVRPKRVYTASNGKQILEAICLIDDKLKRFNLDKVKVIA